MGRLVSALGRCQASAGSSLRASCLGRVDGAEKERGETAHHQVH